MSQQIKQIIKFKSTNTSHQIFQLTYDQNKTVLQYKDQIAQKLNDQPYNIKLIFKGKVLNDKQKMSQLNNIKNSTVMMVLTKTKKQQKATLSSAQQTIPRSNLSTGLGSSSPVGFGGYGIMNHPQYMSAISSAVDQQKMQQIMNDPYYQGMMQQLLDDPDTLKQLLEENPMTKQLMDQNPMMKMIMSNPAMMKMVFSFLDKDTIKMAQEMKKNGTTTGSMQGGLGSLGGLGGLEGLGSLGGLGGLGNLGGLGGFGGVNGINNQNNQNNQPPNMFNNPLFPMMGSGFGNFSGNNNVPQSFPNLFSNPLFNSFNSNTNNLANQPQNNNSFSSLLQTMSNIQQQTSDQQKYKTEIKQLNSMGFNDKEKCIKFLKEYQGDIDKVLQRLCLDDDQKDKKKQ